MSFMDMLKRSLGFEGTEESVRNNKLRSSYDPREYYEEDIEYYEDEYPTYYDNSGYEIMLLRPKNIDDINYIIDQIIEEKNPVIVDFAFLQKESPANFKLASDKINDMRKDFGVEAFLLANTEDKNLVIISPESVKITKK